VVSSFVVMSSRVAADIELADPAGKSSIVMATSRLRWSAAFEIGGSAMVNSTHTTREKWNLMGSVLRAVRDCETEYQNLKPLISAVGTAAMLEFARCNAEKIHGPV
jgi:hypothetical protein